MYVIFYIFGIQHTICRSNTKMCTNILIKANGFVLVETLFKSGRFSRLIESEYDEDFVKYLF